MINYIDYLLLTAHKKKKSHIFFFWHLNERKHSAPSHYLEITNTLKFYIKKQS